MASTIMLKNIPNELYLEILKEQGKVKIYRASNYSLSRTVIKMLKDYIKCREQNNFKGSNE